MARLFDRLWLRSGSRLTTLAPRVVAGLLLPALIFCLTASIFAATKAEKSRQLGQLVEEALCSEIYGLQSERDTRLAEVLSVDPDNQAARWHSGYVRWNNQWVQADRVADQLQQDRRMKSYLNRRADAPITVEGQLQLAQWCEEHKLPDQARAHYTEVLRMDPDNLTARQAQGFVQYMGGWITQDDLRQILEDEKTYAERLARWLPKLRPIVEGLNNSSQARQSAAAQRLAEIEDPEAIPALEQVFGLHSEEAAHMMVDVLGRIPTPESAVSLARTAVLSPWVPVRKAAVDLLEERSMDHYVPVLLSAMQSKVQTDADIYRGPGGRLVYRHTFFREGQKSRNVATLDTSYTRGAAPGGNRDQTLAMTLAAVAGQAQQREAAVALENARTEEMNNRICWVMRQVSQEDLDATPQRWWQWWNDFNEAYVPGEKPVRQVYDRQDIVVNDVVSGGGNIVTCECLAEGTRVWTATGPRAIEEILVGDLVLSQDPQTGELAYKPVLQTTVRPPTRLMRIEAGRESLRTSGGHPLWVAGEGWVKARDLASGHELHTATGSVQISEAVEDGMEPTYNLIVADFHTYFVGDSKILSHDTADRQPTHALVPGLVGD